MKRLTLEQILALYPNAFIFKMLDIRVRKDRRVALKNLAGAYILFFNENGKYYVGSSASIINRMDFYIPSDVSYRAKFHSLILRALFKYGLNSFTLLVLPVQDPTRENLLKLEQMLIDTLLPEYNILTIAGSPKGYTHTDEARSKISKAKKGELNPMFGRKGESSPRYGSGQKLYVYSSDNFQLISLYRTMGEAETAMRSDRRTLKAFAKSQCLSFLLNLLILTIIHISQIHIIVYPFLLKALAWT